MTAPADPTQQPEEEEAPEPVYSRVEDWVDEHFLPMFHRPLGGEWRWCPQWWRHPEAVSRLTAIWRAWEVLRLEPATGIGDWYRDYFDHHFPTICGSRGPFYQCGPDTGHLETQPFPAAPVDYTVLTVTGTTAADDDDNPLLSGSGGPP